jgi:hypothetical protein
MRSPCPFPESLLQDSILELYLYFLSLPKINAQAHIIARANYFASSTTCGMWDTSENKTRWVGLVSFAETSARLIRFSPKSRSINSH